ncbi:MULTISPECIES: WXG100 family type VII secretion target [Streptomyces]|uniref:ESAT-6-like protein n=1 Tax=Streptomyces hokutonensis TaxID=1306990 RepID=A0ABW6MKA3_9ACTN|nr:MULTISPECIES: WXG100 family type VII secretion target [Streptomyces]WSW90929.1 WXG100 family type VII secretion target [Streptomyces sp. NBC_00989]WSX15086.1 WXG100 family type VII secretion target [Streptomyces sp. NBC_00988]WTE41367.1 WXG100 family type VII secretion target [Streptomyces sp. NBC_01622]
MADNLSDGVIYVSYNHMSNAADDMVAQTKAIAQTLSSLEQELGELSKTWYGNDADTYRQKQAAWDGAVQNMETLLTSHSQLLNEISNSYKYSENSLSQMWSEVTIGR